MVSLTNGRDAVIIDSVRTPVAKRNGSFAQVHPTELGAFALTALQKKVGFQTRDVEDLVFGCVTQTNEQGGNVARQTVLVAGWPQEIPGVSVNRMCGSGQQAINFAASGVRGGAYDVVVAGGVESMTRVPIVSDQGPMSPVLMERYELIPQIESADRIATKWGLTREQLDKFSFESHQRAVKAIDEGVFKKEIATVPLDAEGHVAWTGTAAKEVATDEHPRRETTLEKLGTLKTALDTKFITAGNSSGINDAACAVLVTSREAAKKHGWRPRARITSFVSVGSDPTLMLTGPMAATKMVLKKASLSIGDIDLFECNEAFASVPLAWMRDLDVDHARVNVNGGAIALGHPLGASGARLVTTALNELERRKKDRALVTMCIGFGQGIATIIERE